MSRELLDVNPRADYPKSQTVRLGDPVNIVSRDHRTTTSHVLHHNRRVAGNVFANMSRDDAPPYIEGSTRGESHPDGHGFALIKRRLGRQIGTPNQNDEKREIDAFHSLSSP